jgi:hypothetical protein
VVVKGVARLQRVQHTFEGYSDVVDCCLSVELFSWILVDRKYHQFRIASVASDFGHNRAENPSRGCASDEAPNAVRQQNGSYCRLCSRIKSLRAALTILQYSVVIICKRKERRAVTDSRAKRTHQISINNSEIRINNCRATGSHQGRLERIMIYHVSDRARLTSELSVFGKSSQYDIAYIMAETPQSGLFSLLSSDAHLN